MSSITQLSASAKTFLHIVICGLLKNTIGQSSVCMRVNHLYYSYLVWRRHNWIEEVVWEVAIFSVCQILDTFTLQDHPPSLTLPVSSGGAEHRLSQAGFLNNAKASAFQPHVHFLFKSESDIRIDNRTQKVASHDVWIIVCLISFKPSHLSGNPINASTDCNSKWLKLIVAINSASGFKSFLGCWEQSHVN